MSGLPSWRALSFTLLLFLFSSSLALISQPSQSFPHVEENNLHASLWPRLENSTLSANSTLAEALKLVREASAQQGIYNAHRVANPKRNAEVSKDSDVAQMTRKRAANNGPQAPALTPALRKAAALVAEYEAKQQSNQTSTRDYPQPQYLRGSGDLIKSRSAKGTYWLELIKHTGHAPMGANDSWPVFRDVTDAKFAGGAKGDGIHDDTEAINAAIAYGGNCGEGCLSSSVKGTLIYFPAGTYLVSSPINAMYYSQLVGDATHKPTIKTSRNFVGLGAIQSDVYIPGNSGDEWYVEQSNFYRQVRNFVIDIRDTVTEKAAAFHWQVAQATSMTNVYIYASTDPKTTQMGLFTENGSGGFMADVFIDDGGNQQYTVRNFEISRQTDSNICLIWDWGWTWSGLFLMDAPNGFSLLNPEAKGADITPTGSIYVMDSRFARVKNAIKAGSAQHDISKTTIITLDNVAFDRVTALVAYDVNGYSIDVPGETVDHFIIGNTGGGSGAFQQQEYNVNPPTTSLLNQRGGQIHRDPYFYKARPQYEDFSLNDIINVKDHGAKGDGVTDDTAAIKNVLGMATSSKLVYFPAGSYIITSTVTIPSQALITGEVWSQLTARGSFFQDMKDPKPMIKVGSEEGAKGTVEISDIIFTSVGSLPGLILVEWNVAAEKQGSVGMFDSHIRIGGAYGSKLTLTDCPKVTTIPSGCVAASMLLHITPKANGYFENLWAWVADHDIDDAKNTMITVASARGILVESADGPTWLYGTSSEHNMLYQYNFYNTSNFFAGMIQTESPYFQFTKDSASPGPFESSIGVFNNDPDFFDFSCVGTEYGCRMSWAVMAKGVQSATIAGAGLYSWFDAYDQSVCVDAQNCQVRVFNDQGDNVLFWVFNLVTIGSGEMISKTDSGDRVEAKDNTQAKSHPFWSSLALYEGSSDADLLLCDDEDTDPDCLVKDPCDYTKTFPDLKTLQAHAGSIDPICLPYYTLDILSDMLDRDLATYDDANNGYDAVFGDYKDYVHDMVGSFMSEYMAMSSRKSESGGPGNKYFDCTIENDPHPKTQQCPFHWLDLVTYDYIDITYTLRDENGFYKDLADNYGISKTWVELKDIDESSSACPIGGGGAGRPGRGPQAAEFVLPRAGGKQSFQKRCPRIGVKSNNLPQGKKNFDVPNPKDVVVKALPRLQELQGTIAGKQIHAAMGSLANNTLGDLNQVMSLPIFMVSQSIASMETAKAKGKQVAHDKKVGLVVEILSIIFMFIPFLDEFAPDLLFVDGLLEAASFLGNAGLAIKDIVDNPVDAPMDLLGLLTGGGKGKPGKADEEVDYRNLAGKRASIDEATLKKMGDSIKELDGEMQSILKKSCPI